MSVMPEDYFMRVKDKQTKHEYTIVASTFDDEAHTQLKKDATGPDGVPLPAKHYESLSSQSGQKAETTKEK